VSYPSVRDVIMGGDLPFVRLGKRGRRMRVDYDDMVAYEAKSKALGAGTEVGI
jgi:hypothetical protein